MKVNRDPKPVLPAGKHQAIIHRAEEATSKSGNAMMKLSLKVVKDGVTYWVNDYVLANRYSTIDAIFEAIGFPPGGDNFDAEKLEGSEVTIVTKIEEKEGFDPQARVERWVKKTPALDKAMNASPKAAAAAAKSNAAKKPTPVDDDDIPF